MNKPSYSRTYINQDHLSRIPFADKLSESGKNLLDSGLQLVRYPQGRYFKFQNDRLQNLPFILSGTLRVYISSQGGKSLTLYRLYPNDTCVLAAYCILNEMGYPAEAMVDQTAELLLIQADIFKTLYEKEPAVQDFVFSLGLDRIMQLIMTAQEVAFKKLDKRLAQYLLAKFIESDQQMINLKISHQDIADELGTAREVISRILNDFEKRKLISLNRMEISLREHQELQEIAES